MRSALRSITNILLMCASTLLYAADHTDDVSGLSVPLHYDSEYGIYTAKLMVGQNPVQIADAVVDTGSAIMVLVADKTYCPSCFSALTKGTINPSQIQSLNPNKEIKIDYGSANDTAVEYDAPIQYAASERHKVKMKVYVLKKSSQPTSILGMIQHNLRADPINSTPFIVKLMENFNKYTNITFVLCGHKGKSYFHVGPIELPQPLVKTTLLTSQFYEINTTGFYNEKNQSIAKPSHEYGRAILDTGTGGFIILTPYLYNPLYDYLYTHAGAKNRTLSKKFWNKNYCVLRTAVDFNSLPTLKIGGTSLEDNHPYYLTIPPTTYINQAGCDPDHVRLIFDLAAPPSIFTAMRNQHSRKDAGSTPDMIIGTGLLNDYAMKIDYKPEPSVTFYDNETLCIPE